MNSHKQVVKVLSIDGGGIRGIIPALVLAEIERLTGRPACDLFDLIAGTSTGGIIALGVTVPGIEGRRAPRWSAKQLAELYATEGPRIFHRSLLREVETLDGVIAEKYSAKGLEEALEHYMGETWLSEALTDVLITSYDIQRHEPFFFKSFQPRPRRPSTGASALEQAAGVNPLPAVDYRMKLVGRATSAAPTYFKPENLPNVTVGVTPSNYVLVDGGTFANNPAMCAYAETRRNHPEAEVLIISLGTGRLTDSISYGQAKSWGLIQWARPLLGVMMDGSSAAIDYQLDEILDFEQGHYRFQAILETASDSLDDASPANIAALEALAEAMIEREQGRLEEVATRLTDR